MIWQRHEMKRLLREARDLLDHDTKAHVQRDGQYGPCPACDLEARIDKVVRA